MTFGSRLMTGGDTSVAALGAGADGGTPLPFPFTRPTLSSATSFNSARSSIALAAVRKERWGAPVPFAGVIVGNRVGPAVRYPLGETL